MNKIALILLFLMSSSASVAQTTLPKNIEALLRKAELPNSSISALVMPVGQKDATLSFQSDHLMSPASTMKLVTTFIALDTLGPNFHWKTQFLSDATVKEGALNGNLFIRGGGDPNLTWDKLGIMLRSLRQQGIQTIEGDIVLDRSYFKPLRPEINAPQFDENPDAYYNVIPDALLIHSNITTIEINANANNINVKLMMPMDKISLNNQIKLNDRPCGEWKNSWATPNVSVGESTNTEIKFTGSFPKQCQINAYLNILDRNVYIANLISALWKEMGGRWNGKVVDGITPSNAVLLHERQSESLADTLRIINKYSDNAMARIVYLTLGAESPLSQNFTNTYEAANAHVRTWLARQGINGTGLVMENGSGLSRIEKLSAQQLGSILQLAAVSNWLPEFSSSLPIAAIDGSMRTRLKGSNADARARIKTGTLKNVMAIAGFVRDINRVDWIVVSIINNDETPTGKAKAVLDELINWVASGRP